VLAVVLAAGTLAATARAGIITVPLTGPVSTNVFNAYWGVTQTLTPIDIIGDPAYDLIVCNVLVQNFGPDYRYDMGQLTVPGGNLQGANWYDDYTLLPGLWTADVGLNTTTLNGNGDVISFGAMETFQFSLTYQPYVTSTGSASARSVGGDGLPQPYYFPTLSGLNVPVATPEPGTWALVGTGLALLLARRRWGRGGKRP
jgi:hypothetical protein